MGKYVNVNITRQTQAVSQKGFGLPLILAIEKDFAYKEYSGDTILGDIAADFEVATETYKLAAAVLGQSPKIDKIAIHGVLFDEGVTATSVLTSALNTLILTHNDWFYLLCPAQADATITALSQWVATQEKLYFASTLNELLADTLLNQNAVLLVHNAPETYPAEAWVGACATLAPGSFTWTFKTLNGIQPATFSGSEVTTIEDNGGSSYIKEGGVNITSKGQTTSKEYIDIIQSMYYIKARMTENVFGLLVREPKIPFTNNGIGLIVSEMGAALQDAFNNGIIAEDADGVPMFSIDAPTRDEVSTNDKANRVLPNVKWEATLAGAVEKATISGTLVL